MAEYSHEKKVKLAEYISTIRDRDNLLYIKKLIVDNNPSINITKNNNGYFTEFQNLTAATYEKLDAYVSKLKKKQRLDYDIEMSTERNATDSSNNAVVEQAVKTSNRSKYTNAEIQMLNKIKYNDALNKQQGGQEETRKIFKKKVFAASE